jgi:hypothetical protein
MALYRMQRMVHDAKISYKYDPVNHAMGIYWNAINMFIIYLLVLERNKNK